MADQYRVVANRELRVVDLIGRDRLCLHANERPLADVCRASREEADFGQLPSSVATWSEVQAHLTDRCPYHTLQGLIRQADLVVAEYSWLFSRLAVAGEFDWLLSPPSETVAVVDEAHNLAVRVRAELDVELPLDAFRVSLATEPGTAEQCLSPVIAAVAGSDPEEGVPASTLLRAAGGTAAVRAALAAYAEREVAEARLSPARRFLTLILLPDREVVVHLVPETDGAAARVVARIVDPTPQLASGWQRLTAGLCMSGTLAAPADDPDELRYQIPLLGLSENQTIARKYASPFPTRNRRWVFCPDTVGTASRRKTFYPRYAAHIEAIGKQTNGVTAVFFSSYDFLEQVRDHLSAPELERVVIETTADASIDSPVPLDIYREQLERLRGQHDRAYLFAVYAGKIAEGADFPGNLIRTVICVSIPLEWPRLFNRRLRERYADQFASVAAELGDDALLKAEEYANARVPLALVLQACGRGLRSLTDRCAFVLLDARYGGNGGLDWRRFLDPPPYNAARPELAVQTFHSHEQPTGSGDWDPVVIAACARRP
jgi:Rad3-related DNA helicase